MFEALARTAEERPDYLAGLPADDITLFVDALHVPITAFNRAIMESPSIVYACIEDQSSGY